MLTDCKHGAPVGVDNLHNIHSCAECVNERNQERLDLNDPEIRRMVEFNHTPREEWTFGGAVRVRCDTCYQSWPCPTVERLRAHPNPARSER